MRSFALATFRIVAAATLLFAFTAVLVPQGTARADEIDDQIAAMMDAAKAKDEGKCIAKMVELQDRHDQRINDALAVLTKKGRLPKIASNAIRQLAMRKDEAFAKKVKSKLGDKKLFKVDDDSELVVPLAYLDAAAIYANPKNAKNLIKIVKKYIPKHAKVSTRAIKAYGAVQDKEVVDQLILWLIQTESTGQSQGGKNMSEEARELNRKAKTAVIDTLAALTQQEIGDGKSWQDFWDKRRKNYVFPDPNAADVDPATLAEWSDIAYGYTIKKPEGETWTFTDAGTEWSRMRLESRDPKDELVMARVDFMIHNLSTQSPKTIGELAKWYKGDLAERRFSELSKEPEIEERKIGDREFTVIRARGDSGKFYSGWGTIEVRIYLTKVGHICVRMEALTRLGAEPEEQAALWAAVESAEWVD